VPRLFKKKPKILARFLQESPTCIILKDLAQDFGLGIIHFELFTSEL
jgi:hypothetical protein